MELPYRRNVAGILFFRGKILIVRKPGFDFWQFVQGGMEPGESEEETLAREIMEETEIEIPKDVKKLKSRYEWDWNEELQKSRGFKGQKQVLFFINLKNVPEINLQKEELEEFRWVSPEEIPNITKYPKEIVDEIKEKVKELQ